MEKTTQEGYDAYLPREDSFEIANKIAKEVLRDDPDKGRDNIILEAFTLYGEYALAIEKAAFLVQASHEIKTTLEAMELKAKIEEKASRLKTLQAELNKIVSKSQTLKNKYTKLIEELTYHHLSPIQLERIADLERIASNLRRGITESLVATAREHLSSNKKAHS